MTMVRARCLGLTCLCLFQMFCWWRDPGPREWQWSEHVIRVWCVCICWERQCHGLHHLWSPRLPGWRWWYRRMCWNCKNLRNYNDMKNMFCAPKKVWHRKLLYYLHGHWPVWGTVTWFILHVWIFKKHSLAQCVSYRKPADLQPCYIDNQ